MTGLKVNIEQTHVVWTGSTINSKHKVANQIRPKWSQEFTSLGIYYNDPI